MVQGSSGECVEKCGDGLNFGLLECDDGNKLDGDGCSAKCQVELDWTCFGGTPTSSDKCHFKDLEIVGMELTKNNNVILELNKPAYVIG
jgi:cysteine-rich repeat protein